MNKKNYIIHNDLSNSSRKRVDILNNNTKLSDIKEFNNMNITIEEKFIEGTTTKYYIILKPETLKASSTITISKYENMDSYERSISEFKDYKRSLIVTVTTKGEDKEKALDKLIELLQNNDMIDIQFFNCGYDDTDPKQLSDSFSIEYDHGQMQDLKRTIKSIFAAAKKELNIR